MRKYKHKWTLNRSRVHFAFKVVGKWLTIKPSILTANGVHYIDSSSGGGKTLLMNYLIRNLLKKGGFFWANIKEFDHKRVAVFDLKKLYSSGDQKYRLESKLKFGESDHYCKGIVYDELNAFFNRRNNKNREYNDKFVPLIGSTVIHRHIGIPRVYFIGQSVLLQDTQIIQVVKFRHFVKCRFRWRYYFYRNELKMVYAPYKIIVENFKKIGIDEKGEPIWSKIGKEKIKIDPVYLETYNTHAFADLVKDLPGYKESAK